jgi:glycyl-tRNA synthetase
MSTTSEEETSTITTRITTTSSSHTDDDAIMNFTMDDIVSLCKRRGLIFPSSEIYNGYAGFFDYGPIGTELKKNVKDLWWNTFVTAREDVVGLDSSIIHNPTTWKSSGTLG